MREYVDRSAFRSRCNFSLGIRCWRPMIGHVGMRIVALEPFYGGSHRAFLDGWRRHSRHEFSVIGLPARNWKWRMRQAAVTFAEQVAKRIADGQSWDALFCSDMLNLAEFRGLCPAAAELPSVVYFHENQLTYPVRYGDQRDCHFGYTNFTTCLAADAIWFNSEFHRREYLAALRLFLKRMPDFQSLAAIDAIEAKSSIQPPGIEPLPPRGPRRPGRCASCGQRGGSMIRTRWTSLQHLSS